MSFGTSKSLISTLPWPFVVQLLNTGLSRPFLFRHGQVVSTPGALELYELAQRDQLADLSQHCRGLWGNICDEDAQENHHSLREGYRLLSSYGVGGERVWLITEADRSISTFLLPSEY